MSEAHRPKGERGERNAKRIDGWFVGAVMWAIVGVFVGAVVWVFGGAVVWVFWFVVW